LGSRLPGRPRRVCFRQKSPQKGGMRESAGNSRFTPIHRGGSAFLGILSKKSCRRNTWGGHFGSVIGLLRVRHQRRFFLKGALRAHLEKLELLPLPERYSQWCDLSPSFQLTYQVAISRAHYTASILSPQLHRRAAGSLSNCRRRNERKASVVRSSCIGTATQHACDVSGTALHQKSEQADGMVTSKSYLF